MPHALVGLGSNLGDRQELLDSAVRKLAATGGVESVQVSRWRETEPVGGPVDQPRFLNGAALVSTTLDPQTFLATLQEIELSLGRVRHERWSARTVDLDLLLFDDLVLHAPPLEVPHPRMAFRRFVLEPAAEIAGTMIHPTIGWSVAELLEHVRTALPYVAISGGDFKANQLLAAAVAVATGWRFIDFPREFAAADGFGSPSLTVAQAIEFLDASAGLIDRQHWPDQTVGAISSFWVEDFLAVGDGLSPALDSQWQRIAETVVRPKLLVLYDSPEGTQQRALARRARATRKGLGPVLKLSSADPQSAETELVAAIQALS